MYNYKKFNKFLKFFFFKYGMTDKTLGNFTEKVQSVKKILNLWSYKKTSFQNGLTFSAIFF
jgi:hypothetical protein